MKTPAAAVKNSPIRQFFRALLDLIILVVLLAIAFGSGYMYGSINPSKVPDQMKDILARFQGQKEEKSPKKEISKHHRRTTTEAKESTEENAEPTDASSSSESTADADEPSTSAKKHGNGNSESSSAATAVNHPKPHAKKKFWITSSGSDYIGYNITIKLNGRPVDNFFGPGKTLDITRLVKAGDNTLTFEAKQLDAGMNQHEGDESAVLAVHVVAGPTVQENFKPSEVLLTYKRNAAESGNFTDTKHFKGTAQAAADQQ